VRGTFEVFEAAVSAGINKVVFISTTSVYRPDTLYGRSKILAELIAEDYRKHRHMNVVTLRPRGFIPHWDRDVYTRYSEWARWISFPGGNPDSNSSLRSIAPMNIPMPISLAGTPKARVPHSENTIPNITISRSPMGLIRP
jgi:Polysaccharide biosynthesis protein